MNSLIGIYDLYGKRAADHADLYHNPAVTGNLFTGADCIFHSLHQSLPASGRLAAMAFPVWSTLCSDIAVTPIFVRIKNPRR